MQRGVAFEAGWLRDQIKDSVNELMRDPRISQAQKDAFRRAEQIVEGSGILQASEGCADSNFYAASNTSIGATPDAPEPPQQS